MSCIKNIVRAHLEANKFHGLCNSSIECGCALEDFMPCDEPSHTECKPAYKWNKSQVDKRNHETDGQYISWCGDFDFLMFEDKPPEIEVKP